jgi:16S rRNA U516 pseudouridylate synthase RsuA-like enzyme
MCGKTSGEHLYFLNKPTGYILTISNEHNKYRTKTHRKTYKKCRLYFIVRLDRDTTGLIILTNDDILHNTLLIHVITYKKYIR